MIMKIKEQLPDGGIKAEKGGGGKLAEAFWPFENGKLGMSGAVFKFLISLIGFIDTSCSVLSVF